VNHNVLLVIAVLGAELSIKGWVFKIVELDLWTYNYMNENKEMFTQEAIDGAKSFLENKGLLTNERTTNDNKTEQNESAVKNVNDKCQRN